jgi:hypothetical protein
MSIVPLAIAHSFLDKKSTKISNSTIRVVNMMEHDPNTDRMQPMLLLCRTEDVCVNGTTVTINSDPAFTYLNNALERKLKVQTVFYTVSEGSPLEPVRHSSTEEFAFEYALVKILEYEILTVDETARAANLKVEFV